MKRAQRTIVIAALVFGVVGTLFVYGKAKQRGVVTELLTQNFVAVQFSDGQYCESLKDVQLRNWLFATADVVYLDVPEGSSKELLDQLGRLPSLSRVVIRYQGMTLSTSSCIVTNFSDGSLRSAQSSRRHFQNWKC